MDPVTACLICEGVKEVDHDTYIKAWQSLIDSGLVWELQGFYGRTATDLIKSGVCHAAGEQPPQK